MLNIAAMISRKVILTELRDIFLLILLGIAMTLSGLSCRNCVNFSTIFWVMASFTSLMWVALWKGNSYLGDFISRKISWIKYPLKRFIVGVVTTAAYTFLAIYTVGSIYEKSFGVNIIGGLTSVLITLVISLFMHSRGFLFNWRQTAIDAEKHQKETIAAKYENLKNQVNPHFLFNSLNALTNLVYEDQEKAVKFIKQLSEVYRYVIDSRDKEVASFEEELEFLKSYIFLQQIRFGEKLQIEVAVNQYKFSVAPLALQMLIENSIKHNIVSEEDPLFIRMYTEHNFICIENNLQRRVYENVTSSAIGLENICQRYGFLHTEKVQIINGPEKFIVKLPMLY